MTVISPSRALPRSPHPARPTRLSVMIHSAKVAAFRARRLAVDAIAGPPRLTRARHGGHTERVADSNTPLWIEEALAERALQQGKVENLKRACRALDGLVIPAGAVFSFWRQVGPPSASRGFVQGRALQLGCMVPAVGGGLCQLSNALYDAALQAGCEIVERHPHSRIVPGSAAALGRDATVAWNYVDLRFRPPADFSLTAQVTADALIVRLHGLPGAAASRRAIEQVGETSTPELAAESCASCNETGCFRHERNPAAASAHPNNPRRTPLR